MRTHFILLLITITLQSLTAQVHTPVSRLDQGLPCVNKHFNIRTLMTVDSTFRHPLIGEARIDDIYEQASFYFEPICISMSSCDLKIIDNYSYNKIKSLSRGEEMATLFGYPRRINVVFVNEFAGDECGFSLHKGIETRTEAIIFVELGCDDDPAVQVAHHLGKLLGLLETNFDQANELVDGSNCNVAGDMICDTPADPYGMVRDGDGLWEATSQPDTVAYSSNCEFIWEELDNNGDYFTPDTRNIMSQYPCKCQFTPDQYRKMATTYSKSVYKQY